MRYMWSSNAIKSKLFYDLPIRIASRRSITAHCAANALGEESKVFSRQTAEHISKRIELPKRYMISAYPTILFFMLNYTKCITKHSCKLYCMSVFICNSFLLKDKKCDRTLIAGREFVITFDMRAPVVSSFFPRLLLIEVYLIWKWI